MEEVNLPIDNDFENDLSLFCFCIDDHQDQQHSAVDKVDNEKQTSMQITLGEPPPLLRKNILLIYFIK